MPQVAASSFTRYELPEPEILSGTILSHLNIAVIQNMRCDIAEQKLNLPFTPNNVLDYAQQSSYLQGQLDILLHLIDSSLFTQQQLTQEN